MCYNGHLGDIGITGTEPGWEQKILEIRNKLLNAFYNAIPKEKDNDLEKIVTPEFEVIDRSVDVIIAKLKMLY
jgi:hypothetical protein